LADFVAKRFCASERATLIHDQGQMRNDDSKSSIRSEPIVAHFCNQAAPADFCNKIGPKRK
jgi:hypothetical protein